MTAITDSLDLLLDDQGRGGIVKICGLREPVHAVAAAEAGADLIGFIFAPTRRQVSTAVARTCINAARQASERQILAVGVFVNAPAASINQTAIEADLDLIQLPGDEPANTARELNRPVISSFRPRSGAVLADIHMAVRVLMATGTPPIFLHLDGFDPNAWGGTGRRADWALAASVATTCRLLLAGGLDLTNVADAIAQVRPLGVDVSSGVETDGVKDPTKIAAFVAAARQAFAGLRTAQL